MPRSTTSSPVRRRLGVPVAILTLSLAAATLPVGPAAAAGDEWVTVTPMSQARERHVMAPLPDGSVLVAGGVNAGVGVVLSGETYDPDADTWTATPSLRQTRIDATATPLLDGRVLVFAGEGYFGPSTAPSTGDIFDPVSRTWSRTAAAGRFYNGQSATRLLDGRVLVVGGNSPDGGRDVRAEIYDPTTNTWSPAASMSTPRISHTATLLRDGRVLVAGGDDDAGAALDSAEVYDPTTDAWTTTGPLAEAREAATATLLTDGRVLVVGGYDDDSPVGSAEVFTPGAPGSFTLTDPLSVPRGQHTAVSLRDGDVLVSGGASGPEYDPTTSTEIYDVATSTWSTADAMNGSRASHTSLTLPDGTVLVAGGYEAGTYDSVASVERYTPVAPAAAGATRTITIATRDTAKRGDDRLVVSGRLSVEDGPRRCVVDERVLVQRYDARSGRWVRVGVDRTSGGENPGRYRLVTADVRATYRASVAPREVTSGGSTTTCSAASDEVRHTHYTG